jgi:hypothetical protein
MFGNVMNLASGITEGTDSGACRNDLMVEWGGGVSGIYYENDNTGLYSGCNKSADTYVMDHAAVKVLVRPLNQTTAYVVTFDKPMPFPNRIFLATLNEKEKRMYRCFSPFGDCASTSFKNITGGK